LEEIRLLLNLQLEDAYLLTLLLVGQPALEAMVDRQKPLAQRISMVTHLQALTSEETEAYIVHRLQIAGRNETMFTPEAVETIHRISGGLPRRINHICDGCLLEGFLSNAQNVDAQLALRAAQTLRLTPQIGKATQSPAGEMNLPEIPGFPNPPSHQPPTQI
jgi:general secretion pathway protein A